MKTTTVNVTLDTLPDPTPAGLERLRHLGAMPDGQIDTSDAPELSEAGWADAVRGRFYRPVKQQVTARLDADVLAWLRADGRGYQTRMNAILRRAMLNDLKT